MRSGRSGDRVFASLAMLALATLFAGMAVVAWGYSLGDALGPGPGFFPFWLGLIGALLCVVLLAQYWRGLGLGEGLALHWPDRAGALRAGLFLVGLAGFAFLIERLGFRIAAFAFTACLLLGLGVRRPVAIIVFSLVAGFGLFHVFYYWLKVPLPVGAFGY